MNDGGPAFPISTDQDEKGAPCVISPGMSLRDWFAGQALQGIISLEGNKTDGPYTFESRAQWVYQQAGAMLAEREKGKTTSPSF